MINDSNTTTIKITRLSNTIYSSRDVVMLALDKVYHNIGQFILADYRNELGKIDTILVIGKINGTGRDAYSVISTSGDFVVNKVDDLADVSEVSHGIETEIHLAQLKYPTDEDELDWYIVTLGPDGITREIQPIDRSRIFRNLDDNYRWFYIKETKTLKREDDFLSTYENEHNLDILLNSLNKPTITVSYNNSQLENKYYIPELDTTIVNPIFNITVLKFDGTDITENCIIKINDITLESETSDIHDFKIIGSFDKDTQFNISATYLDDINTEKTINFYFPIVAYYGTCKIINGELTIDEENIRNKLIYSDLDDIDITYNLNKERSILIIPQNFGPFSHIFDINGLDYINNYTYIYNFTYNELENTYSAYYKNEEVIIEDFKQKFTYENECVVEPDWESEGNNYYTKSEINEILNNINTDLIKDNETSLEKTWSSEKLSPVYSWVMEKISEEIADKFTIETTSSGESYYIDTNTDTTMTVTVKTKFNGDLVNADNTPDNWNKSNIGTYTRTITGVNGDSINAQSFSYTYNGTTLIKSSSKKTISAINVAYYGLVNSNNGAAEITSQIMSSLNNGRITNNINRTENIINDSAETKYLWILTKNTADATQLGISMFSNNITTGKSFVSPRNNNINLTGYKLYISDKSVSANGSYNNVNLIINI